MKNLGRVSLAVLAGVLVVSCGGGSSGGSGPTPNATSTATPTPTPLPPQTFTYTEFANLTGVQDFGTACFAYNVRANGVPFADGFVPFSGPGVIDLDADSGVWTISEINGGSIATVGPSERVVDTPERLEYEGTETPIPTRYVVNAPPVSGGGFAEYGRNVFFRLALAGGGLQTAICTLGVPTDPDDIPSATTVTYNDVEFVGAIFDENPASGAAFISQIVDSSGTFEGNTETGIISISLTFTVEAEGGARTTIGPLTGEASIDLSNDDRAGFQGILNIGGAPEYFIDGGFYGPQGREAGFVIYANQDQNFDGLNERFALISGYATR